jgi:hypothetical protein
MPMLAIGFSPSISVPRMMFRRTLAAGLVAVFAVTTAGQGAAPPRPLQPTTNARPLNAAAAARSNVSNRSIFMPSVGYGHPGVGSAGNSVNLPVHRRPYLPAPKGGKDAAGGGAGGATSKDAASPPRPIYTNIPKHRLPPGW